MGVSINIYEDTFVKNAISSYNLSALVGADRFSFLGYDKDQSKVQFLKSYNFPSKENVISPSLLQESMEQDNLLKANFNKKIISIVNETCILVPDRLYDPAYLQTYFEKLVEPSTEDIIKVDDLDQFDFKVVYALSKEINTVLEGYFPNGRIFHASTLLFKGLAELSKHRIGHQIYINVYGNKFQIVLFDGPDLLFSNYYSFKSPKDFVYYVMLIYDQFKLKPESIPLYISGLLVENSEVYKMIYRYIRHIHFLELPGFLNFGQQVKSQTTHQYFNLYCSKLCE